MLLVQVNVDPARKAARCHRQLDYCISRACIDCNKEQPHATLHQQHEHPDKQEKNVVYGQKPRCYLKLLMKMNGNNIA